MFFFFDENEPVKNHINRTALEAITIYGLFGKENVSMTFDKIVNIYIGENGLGKTTILNCIYYILRSDYRKLANIPFDKFEIKIKNEEVLSFNKADLLKYISHRSKNRHFRDIEVERIIDDTLEHYSYSTTLLYNDDIQDIIINELRKTYGMPYSFAQNAVMSYLSNNKKYRNGDENKVALIRDKISQAISERVIYLTTYRRIEKDYSEYFNSENEGYNNLSNDALIRFGMNDVSKAISDILETIQTKTTQEFNKMTGVLISKYLSNNPLYVSDKKSISSELLHIVLNRLGDQIKKKEKEKILRLVQNEEIYNTEYQYLYDLIVELINNYNHLIKVYDAKIVKFINTCNRYLNDKEFIYDQSNITLGIYSLDKTKSKIELSMLSSGEKQIISLFSKLYLEGDNKCILLIDEPELSISMRWQKMLLPDIMRSGNCSLLLTVTHSPFIFANEFDNDAKDMWYCFNNRGNI